MLFFRLFSSFFMVLIGIVSGPQLTLAETLALNAAENEGLAASPALKRVKAAQAEALAERREGWGDLIPQVNLSAGHVFDAQYATLPVNLGALSVAVPEVPPRTFLGAEAKWTIFDGFGNVNRLRAKTDLLSAAEQETARQAFETKLRIELSFYAALAAQRFADVASENVKTLQQSLAQAESRLRNGVSTEYDVLRVQVQFSDAEIELEKMNDNVVIYRKQLAAVMGRNGDDRVLEGELPAPTQAEAVKTLMQPKVSDRQDLIAAQLKSEASQKTARAQVGQLVPSIGLLAEYQHYENTDYPAQAYGGFRDAWSLGVFAKWSLFDGGITLARASAAQARADQSEQIFQEASLNLPADFELWQRRYLYSAKGFVTKNQNLKRSEESFRIAGVSFAQGRKTITDVLDAENDLFRARAGVVQAMLDAEEAKVKLELTIGKEF